jgi:hypothetical protein
MDVGGERLIRLALEQQDRFFLVSSPEFPLLHLSIRGDDEIESVVMPVLKEMIRRDTSTDVELRVIRSYGVNGSTGKHHDAIETVAPHLIARLAA